MVALEAAGLVQREVECAHLQRVVDHAVHGVGRLVVIAGPAGIGKTSLLAVARGLAHGAGMQVRVARGAELEQNFAFGAVRQLFDPLLACAGGSQRAQWLAGAAELAVPLFDARGGLLEAGGDQSVYPLLHGLYWLCSNVAGTQPLALLVDDAQWVDEPSLSFLGFLARRLEELAVVLVVGSRPADLGASPLLVGLLEDPSARVVAPRALSADGVERFLSLELGREVEDGVARACYEVTAGNPFLLHRLADELRERDLAPVGANAGAVRALAPRRVADSVLVRLGRLSEAAPPLANAVAVLGDGAALSDAAALAGVDEQSAIGAAVAMRNADVFVDGAELGFGHPIIRESIYQSLLPAERDLRHAAAARLLRGRGAPAEQVAAQILLADGYREPWVVEQLQLAASSALALGAPLTAVGYLRRALEHDREGSDRPSLVAQLGRAEVLAGLADGPRHLEEALALTADPDERVRLAITLAQVLKFTGQAAGVVELLGSIGPAADEWLNDQVQVELLSAAQISQAAHELLDDCLRVVRGRGVRSQTERDHFELVVLAFERMLDNRPLAEVLEPLARAAPDQREGEEHVVAAPGSITRGVVYTYCGQLDHAAGVFSDVIERARKRGALVSLLIVLAMRGEVAYRRGDLGKALADATEALRLSSEVAASGPMLLRAISVINSVAVEQERTEAEFEALLVQTEQHLDHDTLQRSLTLLSQARLLVACGDDQRALDLLLALGSLPRATGVGAPAYVPWRSEAALVLCRLGDRAGAQRMAEQELALAQTMSAPHAVGVALRACALVRTPPAIDLLREAAAVLDRSPARLEYARALTDLGASLRRAGERAESRELLTQAQELALRCGATRLASRAHDELAASGARAAAPGLTGVPSLTPSERRVAELAAQGNTNRQIAQALFVSEKTVETHLSHSYAKLDVRSRHKLRDVLDRAAVTTP